MEEIIKKKKLQNEPTQNSIIFENPMLEKLVHTNSWWAITTYTILAAIVLFLGMQQSELPSYAIMGWFIFGWFVFTFVEYIMHRFVYHSGDYDKETEWQYKAHGVHHAHPKQKDQLAMPIPIALLLFAIFYFLFKLIMGKYNLLFLPGFMVGYSFYLTMHYVVHAFKPPKNFLKWYWRHHHLHHYKYDNKAFGLTVRIWDRLFGTMPPSTNNRS